MITFCTDEQTEVLTRDGWKGWESLSEEDQVATRSADGNFEWQRPDAVHCSRYAGKMIRINSKGMDALVTPDHRMYGKFIGGRGIASGVNGNWKHAFIDKLENRFLKAAEAMQTNGYYPVLTSVWKAGTVKEFVIPPSFMRQGKGAGTKWGLERQPERRIDPARYAEFMGWYLSEGCVIQKHNKVEGFAIGQSESVNPQKRYRILQLLKEMGLTPHTWMGGINGPCVQYAGALR